jgi:hypothetical protein
VEVSSQIPMTASTRYFYVGHFLEAARAAARANLSLRDWTHLDATEPLRVSELREEMPAIE